MSKHKRKPTRRCVTCHMDKPRSQFPSDGRGYHCQQCLDERVPTRPLVRVIDHLAAQLRIGHLWTVATDDSIPTICSRAGIGLRLLAQWRRGAHPDISFAKADEVLTSLDLLWFDVFNEDTVRIPALTATVYRHRRKRVSDAGGVARFCWVWETVSTDHYGDLGPDHAELARIQRAFCGDEAVAA